MDNKNRQVELTLMLTEQLPRLRKLYSVSQSRLGTLIGKSRQQISEIERMHAPMSWDTCLAIILLACNKDKSKFVSAMGKQYLSDINQWINNEYDNIDE